VAWVRSGGRRVRRGPLGAAPPAATRAARPFKLPLLTLPYPSHL
jgi:hypothetical protein